MRFLDSLPKMAREQLARLIAGKTIPPQLAPPQGKKRDVTEVVVTLLRLLGPTKNGNGAKLAESSRAAAPVDESDNPFDEMASDSPDSDIPF
jgi:hypothetical protein